MTVVTTKEFNANQEKYFDLALNEEIFVKRDNVMFIVTRASDKKKKYLKPDDDFRRAISMDELRRRVKEDIHQWYKERNESNSITRSTTIS